LYTTVNDFDVVFSDEWLDAVSECRGCGKRRIHCMTTINKKVIAERSGAIKQSLFSHLGEFLITLLSAQ
jgi:hypothetical protein